MPLYKIAIMLEDPEDNSSKVRLVYSGTTALGAPFFSEDSEVNQVDVADQVDGQLEANAETWAIIYDVA